MDNTLSVEMTFNVQMMVSGTTLETAVPETVIFLGESSPLVALWEKTMKAKETNNVNERVGFLFTNVSEVN